MPRYVYRAKEGPDKTVDGEVTAESRQAAQSILEGRGVTPVWVEEKDGAARSPLAFRLRRIRFREVTVFTRQLGSLLKAGVPILKALATVEEQTENPALRGVIEDLKNTTRGGSMLSGALAKYPALFPDLYVNMARSGESAGALDTILLRLADAREAEEDTRRRVQAAMAYPALVLGVGVVTVFVLLTFFLPRMVTLFAHYKHRALPLPTRLLLGASDFFSNQWYWVVIVVVLLGALYRRMLTAEKGRALLDTITLRIPILGRFIRNAEIARFARTLGLLLRSGISIDRALTLAATTLRNAVMRGEIEAVRRQTVDHGAPFSSGLRKASQFPAFVANMAAVGEESGRLEDSLDEIALYYEKETEQQGRLMTALLEPILILVVGGIVGFIVAAMLLPIFELSTTM